MPLGAQALAEFDLPAAPQRIDDLPSPVPGAVLCRIHAPGGRFLLLWSEAALGVAFETTLFELLVEARFPAPRPRRTRAGSMIARLSEEGRTMAAACYPWPPGDPLSAAAASVPQLMEIGRLLARLHQLGETHPVSVADPWEPMACPPELAGLLAAGIPPLPSGAVHGRLGPSSALFIGDRCSAVLPSGAACSTALLLDLAQTAMAWLADSPRPVSALRAVMSGYQSLRRLLPEEQAALFAVLRYAAAREGVRRGGEFGPLVAVDAIGEAEVRAASGAT